MVKSVVQIIVMVVVSAGLLYGSYWVAKTVSYKLFYEDMVRETVTEMLEEED